MVFWLLLWPISKPRAVAKTYSLYRLPSRIWSIKNATLFLPSAKYRRVSFAKKFRRHIWPNGAHNFRPTVSTCKTPPPNQWKWKRSEVIDFLLCAVKSISVSRPMSRADLHCNDLQQGKNDFQFCWHKPAVKFHLHQLYVSLYLGRCFNTVQTVQKYILQNDK